TAADDNATDTDTNRLAAGKWMRKIADGLGRHFALFLTVPVFRWRSATRMSTSAFPRPAYIRLSVYIIACRGNVALSLCRDDKEESANDRCICPQDRNHHRIEFRDRPRYSPCAGGGGTQRRDQLVHRP